MPLCDTIDEKRLLSEMEELYAIMRTTEHLETAYIRDLISADEYKTQCRKLQTAYDMQKGKLTAMRAFSDIGAWMKEYEIKLPQAYMRLEIEKLPATDMHYSDDGRPEAQLVAETTSALITATDGLNLNRIDVDQVLPSVAAVLESLNHHAWLPTDFDPKVKMQKWVRELSTMRAADSLNDEQVRQLEFDLQQAYSTFLSKLGELKKK